MGVVEETSGGQLRGSFKTEMRDTINRFRHVEARVCFWFIFGHAVSGNTEAVLFVTQRGRDELRGVFIRYRPRYLGTVCVFSTLLVPLKASHSNIKEP